MLARLFRMFSLFRQNPCEGVCKCGLAWPSSKKVRLRLGVRNEPSELALQPIRIGNDQQARVELLRVSCPSLNRLTHGPPYACYRPDREFFAERFRHPSGRQRDPQGNRSILLPTFDAGLLDFVALPFLNGLEPFGAETTASKSSGSRAGPGVPSVAPRGSQTTSRSALTR